MLCTVLRLNDSKSDSHKPEAITNAEYMKLRGSFFYLVGLQCQCWCPPISGILAHTLVHVACPFTVADTDFCVTVLLEGEKEGVCISDEPPIVHFMLK